MIDLGHGKDMKGVKTIDPSTPLAYSSAPTLTPGSDELATMAELPTFNAQKDPFVTTAAQDTFNLSQSPSGFNAVGVFKNGIYVSTYTILGSVLTWTGPVLAADQDIRVWYDFSAPAGNILSQLQTYYFGDAGNDSNSGKSNDVPFLTIGAAISAATSQTPSSSNQFTIEAIGAIDITPDFTLPAWVNLYAPGARLSGNVIVNDNTVITCMDSLEPSTGSPPRNFSKTSGTGSAIVNILGKFECGVGRGMNCTSGSLIVNTVNADHGTGYLIGDGSGISILNSSGIITNSGGGFVCLANGGGKYDIHHNRMTSTSSNAVFGSGSSGGVLKARGGFIDATGGGRLYQFSVASQFTLQCTGYDETNASTNIGGSTLILNIGRNPSDQTIISNSIDFVVVNGTTF